jgi:hypothetical protein
VFFRLIDAGVSPQEALTRIYGNDIDSRVVELCRIRLALNALSTLQQPTEDDWNEFLAIAACQIQVKEALLEAQWGHGFDLIVGNPPFVSAREMVKSGQLEFRQQLAKRYRSARGAFDLAGVFVERSLELLNPGGKLGMVVPHKLFAAEYGAPIKALLDQSCREHTLLDFSHEQFFHHARVYPKIILAAKAEDSKADRFHLKQTSNSSDNQILAKINARSSPLSRWCQIQCGTAGFSASRLAKGLIDGRPESLASWPFRVSGNIDPYRILQKPLRYQHRRYQDPYLIDSAEYVTSIQRRLFSSSKIVVAGMVRCLEAAFDLDGIALGVNTYACTGWTVDPFFLLGVLNSKAASYYYREQFSNKHLAGDYITINKGTLGRLPVPEMDSKTIQQIKQMVTGDLDQSALDDLFFEFYGLSSAEIDTLLSSLPPF